MPFAVFARAPYGGAVMASAGGGDLNRVIDICVGTVGLLLCAGECAAEPSWQHVKAVPVGVRDHLEIAREAQGKTPASLYFVCSQNAEQLLVLLTRLPAPRWSLAKGRDDNVSLFVGSIDRQLRVVMQLVSKGQDVTGLEAVPSRDGDGEPDTLVTTPLDADDIATISSWFGDAPPSNVSVVGYAETGVFMAGTVAGPAISEFSSSCVAK